MSAIKVGLDIELASSDTAYKVVSVNVENMYGEILEAARDLTVPGTELSVSSWTADLHDGSAIAGRVTVVFNGTVA